MTWVEWDVLGDERQAVGSGRDKSAELSGEPNFIRLGLDCEKGVERNNNTANGVIVVFGSRKEKEGL